MLSDTTADRWGGAADLEPLSLGYSLPPPVPRRGFWERQTAILGKTILGLA